MIQNVTVFCASSPSGDRAHEYLQMARAFGLALAKNGLRCVNGGSRGLMKEISVAAHAAGGEVHCVLLEGEGYEIDHDAYTTKESLFPLSIRQQRLVELGDAYVALSGGIGTHYEIFEILCKKMMGEIPQDKPLICIGDTYRLLQSLLQNIVRDGLAFADPFEHILFVDSSEDAIDYLCKK